MKRWHLASGLFLFSLSLSTTATRGDALLRAAAERDHLGGAASVPSELVVAFKDASDDRTAARAIWEAGGARAQRSRFGPRFRVTLDAGFTVQEAIRPLRQ